ncbi:MAG: YciI family protein [Solirubrobacterales bacterium]
MRQFQLYGMFGTPTDQWDFEGEVVQRVLPAHATWIFGLEETGVMFMGGPFRAPDYEWDGSGVIFLRADSLAEAQKEAERDPLFIEGLRTYDVRGWQLNEGRLNLSLNLHSNRIDVA